MNGVTMFTSPEEVLSYIRDEGVVFVDIRFTDLLGGQHHFNVPAESVDEDFFTTGQLFDGSSIPGFAGIADSDLQLIPDVETAFVDPFRKYKTLCMSFSILSPRTGEAYVRDPRSVAQRAEDYVAATGIADTAIFAAEAEFYIFDSVRFEAHQPHRIFVTIDSDEAYWNDGTEIEGGNLGHRNRAMKGYFPVPPVDKHADLRDEISLLLGQVGLEVERSTTKSGPGARGRLTTNSIPWCVPLTTSSCSSTSSKVQHNRPVRRLRSCPNPSLAMAAPVCTVTSRYGWMANRCSMTSAAMPTFLILLAGTLGAFSSTVRQSLLLPTQR